MPDAACKGYRCCARARYPLRERNLPLSSQFFLWRRKRSIREDAERVKLFLDLTEIFFVPFDIRIVKWKY